eukprot:NODE_45_length_32908_cov_0.790271.p27 type:complete len:126 gc:universal NODE_45_length_32908_cov_0.790271:25853-26230(+)
MTKDIVFLVEMMSIILAMANTVTMELVSIRHPLYLPLLKVNKIQFVKIVKRRTQIMELVVFIAIVMDQTSYSQCPAYMTHIAIFTRILWEIAIQFQITMVLVRAILEKTVQNKSNLKISSNSILQ